MSAVIAQETRSLICEGLEEIRESMGFPGGLARNPTQAHEQAFTLGYLTAKLWQTKLDVATISDRAPLNLESIAAHAEQTRSFRLRGVVLPGSELDQDVERIMAFESILRAAHDGDPEQMERLIGFGETAEPIDRGDFILQRRNVVTDEWEEFFRSSHETYDAKKLRAPGGEGDLYRRNLGNRIISHLRRIDPDLIFLDNYKVILPPEVIQAFPEQFVNVHNSILPLIKGYRSEMRAFGGENPEANGFTIHVVSEDLDGGPTLLQQRVFILPFDHKAYNCMGKEEYQKYREEQSRVRIMAAQSRVVPWVLHLYGSDLDRKTVEGRGAFKAEGRAGFQRTKAYKQATRENPDGDPYRRILFENPLAGDDSRQPKYVTIEQMLSIPGMANISPHINGIHHYDFNVPLLPDNPNQADFTDMQYLEKHFQALGIDTDMQTGNITYDCAEISLRALTNCDELLTRMGIPYRYRQQRVHVQTPRVPVATRPIRFVTTSGR